jgi:hypothetical protein
MDALWFDDHKHLRLRERGRVLQRPILEPEQIEIDLVALDRFRVAVWLQAALGLPGAPGSHAGMAVGRVIAVHEGIEV